MRFGECCSLALQECDEGLLVDWVDYSFLPELRMNRVHEEVDLQVKLELHRLGFLVSHRDGHVLVEPRHEVLAVALLECLHYEQHTSTSSCRKD